MNDSESRQKLRALVRPFLPEEDEPGARLRLALQMMAAGFEMKRASLTRQFPLESWDQIDVRLRQWIEDQPVPPHLISRQLPDKYGSPSGADSALGYRVVEQIVVEI